jgi:hypothetical protein
MCPRPKRKRIKFTEDSVNELLQEIYDESHNQKAKITRLFTKWEQKVKEGGDIQAIGDQIMKVVAADAKNQDQRLLLLKFLKEVVFSNGKNTEGTATPTQDVSTERRNALLDLAQEGIDEVEEAKEKDK